MFRVYVGATQIGDDDELVQTLTEHGIEPVGSGFSRSSIHCEHRVVSASELGRSELSSLHILDGGEPTANVSITDKASQGDSGIHVDVSVQEEPSELVESEPQRISIPTAKIGRASCRASMCQYVRKT